MGIAEAVGGLAIEEVDLVDVDSAVLASSDCGELAHAAAICFLELCEAGFTPIALGSYVVLVLDGQGDGLE